MAIKLKQENKEENPKYVVILQHMITKKKDKVEFVDKKTFKQRWKEWQDFPAIGFNYKILSEGY
jgi:hypothetical protein